MNSSNWYEHKNDVAIVVPLYGRNDLTKRLIYYHKWNEFPYKMYLVDGSSERYFNHRFDNEQENLWYRYYGEDLNISDFVRKMAGVFSSVKEPYTLMLDNDDLYDIDGVANMTNLLVNSPGWVSGRGKVASMKKIDGKWREESVIYKTGNVDRETVSDRFYYSKDNLNSHWHDLTETKILRDFFMACHLCEVDDLTLVFTLIDFYIACSGKCWRNSTENYYYHFPGRSTVQGTGKMTRLRDWMKIPEWKESMAQAVAIIANAPFAIGNIRIWFLKDFYGFVAKKNERPQINSEEEHEIMDMSHKYNERLKEYFQGKDGIENLNNFLGR